MCSPLKKLLKQTDARIKYSMQHLDKECEMSDS